MLSYILRRIAAGLPVLFGISLLAFFLVRVVPGDTVTVMLGNQYNEAMAEALRAKYGLDQPVIVQYVIWLKGILSGDFGQSSVNAQPVVSAIIERLPVTLELTAISLLFAVFIGIPLGVWAAVRRNSLVDYCASFFGLIGISVPGFWLGTLFILFFSLKLGWLPSGGFTYLWVDPVANLKCMVMPGIALGTAVSAVVMRMSRSAMLEVIEQEYIKMAKAKGVPEFLLTFRHALKNALVPIITILGLQVGSLLGGSVVIEQVFSLPGIGQLALSAITERDYPMMQGTIMFIATTFLVINLLVDVLYAFINPRIRY